MRDGVQKNDTFAAADFFWNQQVLSQLSFQAALGTHAAMKQPAASQS